MGVTAISILRDYIFENPMLDEMGRMGRKFTRDSSRARKGPLYYVVAVALSCLGLFGIWWTFDFNEDLSMVLLFIELIVVTLIVPQSIYGAIAGERERATWEALILTRLTPGQIIIGKLLPRVLLGLLIIGILMVPMTVSHIRSLESNRAATSFIVYGQVMIFAWVVLLTTFGLFVSANNRQISTAAVVTFGSILGGLLFLPILIAMFEFFGSSGLLKLCLQFNPFVLLAIIPSNLVADEDRPSPVIFWSEPSAALIAALVYFIFAIVFLYATSRCLKKLEEPKRRSG